VKFIDIDEKSMQAPLSFLPSQEFHT